MSWYFYKRGSFVPDYSVGRNENLTILKASTLEKAKEELYLANTNTNIAKYLAYSADEDSDPNHILKTFKTIEHIYRIEEAKLLHVDSEIDLEQDILEAREKITKIRSNSLKTIFDQRKQERYQQYLKLKKEFEQE